MIEKFKDFFKHLQHKASIDLLRNDGAFNLCKPEAHSQYWFNKSYYKYSVIISTNYMFNVMVFASSHRNDEQIEYIIKLSK